MINVVSEHELEPEDRRAGTVADSCCDLIATMLPGSAMLVFIQQDQKVCIQTNMTADGLKLALGELAEHIETNKERINAGPNN